MLKLISFISYFFIFLLNFNLQANEPVFFVKTDKVTKQIIDNNYSFIVKTKYAQQKEITSEVNGTIEHLTNKTLVKKNEIIAKINNELAGKLLSQAKTNLELAKKKFLDAKKLYEEKIISEIEFITNKNNLANAEYAYQQKLLDHKKFIIKAPFDGQLGVIKPLLHQQIKPGDIIVNIINNKSGFKAYADLPTDDIKYFKINDNINIKFENKTLSAKITSLTQNANSYGNSEIAIDIDYDSEIADNSYYHAELELPSYEAYKIPALAAQIDDKGTYIFIAENDIAKKIYIQPIEQINDQLTLKADSELLDKSIVTEGAHKLFDGAKLKLE